MFDNGRALIVAEHIQDIREVKKPGCLSEILAYSIPQVKIRQPPYNIFMQLDDDRKIIKLECQCPQGDPGMSTYFDFKKSLTKSSLFIVAKVCRTSDLCPILWIGLIFCEEFFPLLIRECARTGAAGVHPLIFGTSRFAPCTR